MMTVWLHATGLVGLSFLGGYPHSGNSRRRPGKRCFVSLHQIRLPVLLGALAVSGCVGSGGTLDLSQTTTQPPLELPTYADAADTDSQPVVAVAALPDEHYETTEVIGGVAIPKASPKPKLALQAPVNETANGPELAIAEVSSDTATSVPSPIITAETAKDPISGEHSSEAADAIEVAAIPTADQPVLPEAGQLQPEPASKNLLERLFSSSSARSSNNSDNRKRFRSGRDDDGGRIAAAHRSAKRNASNTAINRKVVALQSAPVAAGVTSLPGVKSNDELLGITPSEETKPEQSNTQLAAAGSIGLLSPNGIRVQHEKVKVDCIKPGVIRLLNMVERRYGSKPIVTSGYRSPNRNRRAGGARNSQHIFCKAVDIQVEGVSKWELAKFLRTLPGRGGVGTYCRTRSVHIDIGTKRDWHHPCRRRAVKKRKKA